MTFEGSDRGLVGKISLYAGCLGGFLFFLTAFFVTVEVFMRFVLRSPTTWITETDGLLVIAATFLSLGYSLREKSQVKVDFITAHIAVRPLAMLDLFTSGLACIFCIILAWQGVIMSYRSYQMGEISALVGIPLWIPYLSLPLGTMILFFQYTDFMRNDLLCHLRRSRAQSPSLLAFLPVTIFLILLICNFWLLTYSSNLGLLALFFLLLFSGIPVAYALGLFGVIGLYLSHGGISSLIHTAITAYATLDSSVIVALPLFILNSTILEKGGVGPRLFRFVNTLVGHWPGGLGIATVVFCGLFAAMTGSSVAVAAAVSVIALPELLVRGYSRKFTIGLLAAGGTLGILFPPSLPLILYAAMTGESLGSLFMASVVPGVILMAMFISYILIVAIRNPTIGKVPRASRMDVKQAFKDAWTGLMVILVIVGGIYSGITTPTEAGGIAVVYSFILCFFVYKSLSFAKLKDAVLEATRICAMMLFIVIGANITGQLVTMSQVPQKMLSFMNSLNMAPWLVVLSINIFLIIMGGPLEAISIMVISLPILYPLVTNLNLSGVWFAVIMMINMELALISPPEGLNLFILQNLGKATTAEVSWGVVPYLIIMCIFLLLISLFPSIALWLPSLVMR